MFLTQRNQYALRAIVELAKRVGSGPVKVSEIAAAQAIPRRFLEVILGQLKGSGLVTAKRGYHGGYFLLREPETITEGSAVVLNLVLVAIAAGAFLALNVNQLLRLLIEFVMAVAALFVTGFGMPVMQ